MPTKEKTRLNPKKAPYPYKAVSLFFWKESSILNLFLILLTTSAVGYYFARNRGGMPTTYPL